MITFAKKEMLPHLMELWQECFGDEEAFIQFYFEKRFKAEEMLVWLCEEGIPRGMLSLLPASWQDRERTQLLYYVYAVGTAKSFRGKGISTELLEFAKDYVCQKDGGLFLIPATPSLYDFYQKRGFETTFFIKEQSYQIAEPKKNGSVVIAPITARQYNQIRQDFLATKVCVHWDEQAIDYVLAENQFFDGFAYQLQIEGVTGGVIGYRKDDTVFIRELLLPPAMRMPALEALLVAVGGHQINLRTPADEANEIEPKRFAMSFSIADKKEGYLNLALE